MSLCTFQPLPLKASSWLLPVRISPLCRTVFCLFARPIFTIGEFSTTLRAQLQGFKKLQGYYREGRKREAGHELTRNQRHRFSAKTSPFQRKNAFKASPFQRG